MNALEQYLKKHSLSQKQLADRFVPPVSQGLIWQWLAWLDDRPHGTRITAERAIEIERITQSELKREDLRPDVFGKQAA